MEQGTDIEEPYQLAAPDVLTQIGHDRKDWQFLHQETHQDVYRKIIQDKAAKDPDDILAGKKMWQVMLEGEAQEEGTRQQVKDHKSDEDLCSQVFSGAPTSPEGPPLMG
jgi:hypothetical protein